MRTEIDKLKNKAEQWQANCAAAQAALEVSTRELAVLRDELAFYIEENKQIKANYLEIRNANLALRDENAELTTRLASLASRQVGIMDLIRSYVPRITRLLGWVPLP